MKKNVLMLVLMLVSVVSFGQNEVGSITLQPKVGVNIANLSEGDADARIGLAAGAEFEYQISDMFSLSAGVIYSQQGAKASNITTKLDYVNVPILVSSYVAKNFAFKLGVQPGFKVNSQISAKVGSTSGSADFKAKSVDFSIPIGLSYQISNFVIDGRYNWGLTEVVEGGKSKNSVFQFTIGYRFRM